MSTGFNQIVKNDILYTAGLVLEAARNGATSFELPENISSAARSLLLDRPSILFDVARKLARPNKDRPANRIAIPDDLV